MLPSCYTRLPFTKRRAAFDLSLYLIANKESFQNDQQFFTKVMAAVNGGVTCVQFKDHISDLSTTIRTALHLKSKLNGVPLFINTHRPYEVVRATKAEGVFLEDGAPSCFEARKYLGEKVVIGTSADTVENVLACEESGVDYVSIKISPSRKTCMKNDKIWAKHNLKQVFTITRLPIVIVGGLDSSHVKPFYQILRLGDGIGMASGLMDTENPAATAQHIQSIRQQVSEEK